MKPIIGNTKWLMAGLLILVSCMACVYRSISSDEHEDFLIKAGEIEMRVSSDGAQIVSFKRKGNDGFIRIEYLNRNISDTVKSVGPWEVTRVPCGGLAFFPGDGAAAFPLSSLKPDLQEEVEIYVDREKSYTELENHGAYQVLQPGGTLRYVLEWYLVPFPEGLMVEPGRKELVSLVRQLISS